MKKKIIAFGSTSLALLLLCSCNTLPEQGAVDIGDKNDNKIATEILSETKNQIVTVGTEDASFKLSGVSEDETSTHVANEKFELNLASTVTGLNVYDPSEVDIYGQFVSPSGELYEMPAFWYKGHERTFTPYDLTADYDIVGSGEYFAQGNANIYAVLDQKDGVNTPVGKLVFNNTDANAGANGGAVISKSGIGTDNDTVSVWLKAGNNFTTTGLYLYFYGEDDQAYVKLPELTTEWTKYSFTYGATTTWAEKKDKNGNLILDKNNQTQEVKILTDTGEFTHSNIYNPLPLSEMYSVRIQTNNGIPAGQTGALRATAVGDVYISDMQYYWSQMPTKSVQLTSFVGDIFEKYIDGDIFGLEKINETGSDNFKLRFRFTEAGEWTYRIVGEKNGKKKFSYTASVTATANPDTERNRGIIRVEQTKKRNFVFEDGTPYMPIGMNVCYSQDTSLGSTLYDVYYPKMKAAGMNFARTWLTDIDAGYGAQNVAGGILNFDYRQDKSFQFDRILELAAENELYLQIPMQAITAFRKDAADVLSSHRWDTNPYNKLNGGYLDEPWEYFTDKRAIEDTKKLYRYYVARYSYSRNIHSWEIMNELGMDSTWYFGVELTQEEARDWADEIGSYLHSIDPYDHLVTVSSGNDHSDKVYEAEALDFVSFHWYYSRGDYATALANEAYTIWQHFGKPVLLGETGASGMSEAYNHDKDPYGMFNKQTAFTVGMAGGASGGTTFWEECVNKYDQYGHYTPAVEMYKLFGKEYITLDTLLSDRYTVGGASANNIKALGFIGTESVYAYILNTQYNYSNLNPAAITDSSVEFNGLSDGMYAVQVFDTKTAVVVKTYAANTTNGKLNLPLDSWNCDVALIINKA